MGGIDRQTLLRLSALPPALGLVAHARARPARVRGIEPGACAAGVGPPDSIALTGYLVDNHLDTADSGSPYR